MRQLSRTVVRNSAFGMLAQVVIKLLSFGFSVLIVRNLGVAAFGQYAAVLAFGALFAILSDLGLASYSVRAVARQRTAGSSLDQVGEIYGNVLFIRLLLALLASACVVGFAWLTGRPLIMVGAIALNAIGLLLYGVQGSSDAVLAGFERLDLSAAARVMNQVAFVILGAVALWRGAGYYGLIAANLAGVTAMMVICWRAVRRIGVRARPSTPKDWPALIRAALPFGLIGLTLGFSYKFDSVLLNIFRGDVETGYYNVAYNLVFAMITISNVVNTALYPSLARQSATAPQTLPDIYQRALRYLMVIALPIAVGGWSLADQIIPFLYSSAYQPATQALRILIWVIPLMFVSEFLGYIVVIAGNEIRVARALIISTACNVGLNLLLVPRFGFLAAALMTVITEVVLVAQYSWMLRTLLSAFSWGRTLLRPLLAALLMGALVAALHGLPLIANVIVGALAYVGLLVALRVIGGDELSFVRALRRGAEARQMLGR